MSVISQLDQQASFERVIENTQQLLNQIENNTTNPDEVTADVIHLLSLDKGPRGFFATFLTDSRPIADQPPESILTALRRLPGETTQRFVQNLTHNLAMSTAMIVHHQRSQNPEAEAGSKRVQQRSQMLVQQLNRAEIREALEALKYSTTQPGKYSEFLTKWKYDLEQKQAIADIVTTTLADHST